MPKQYRKADELTDRCEKNIFTNWKILLSAEILLVKSTKLTNRQNRQRDWQVRVVRKGRFWMGGGDSLLFFLEPAKLVMGVVVLRKSDGVSSEVERPGNLQHALPLLIVKGNLLLPPETDPTSAVFLPV